MLGTLRKAAKRTVKFDPARRKALGGIAAAPLAAGSLGDMVKTGNAPLPGGFYGGIPDQAGGMSLSYFQERKAELLRRISGQKDEREEASERYQNYQQAALQYDSMRSVSPVNRARMYRDWSIRQNREQQKLWASWELKDLLKRYTSFNI